VDCFKSWNVFYTFHQSDFGAAHSLLNMVVNSDIIILESLTLNLFTYIFSYLGRFPLVNLLFVRGSGVTGVFQSHFSVDI